MRRAQVFSKWFSAVIPVLALSACAGDNLEPEVGDWVVEEPALGDEDDTPTVLADENDHDPTRRPMVILHGTSKAEAFTAVDDRLVWLEYDEAILLKTARPHGNIALVAGKLVERPMAYVMTTDHVFWTSPQSGRLYRLSLDGGPADVLVDKGAPLALVALDKQLWFGDEDGCVRRVSQFGGKVDEIACGAADSIIWLTVASGVVHWATDGGDLYRAPAEGGEAELRATGEYFDSDLLVDARRVYWTSAARRAIRSLRHDDVEVQDVARAQYQPSNLTMDRFYLYYATDSDDSIKRVIKDGGLDPVVLASGIDHAGDISRMDDYLYWMNQDGGDVFAMRLP